MKKRLFAAVVMTMVLVSVCACADKAGDDTASGSSAGEVSTESAESNGADDMVIESDVETKKGSSDIGVTIGSGIRASDEPVDEAADRSNDKSIDESDTKSATEPAVESPAGSSPGSHNGIASWDSMRDSASSEVE